MNWKKWAPAALAVILGLAAAMLARNMMTKSHATAVAPLKAVQVVTATGPLMVGQEIRTENVELTTIPAPQPPPDAFTNPADVVGRVLTSSLIKGQNVVTGNLAPLGVVAGLQSLIPAGKRAITINVDEGNAQAGMLLPGCRIDILATIAAGKASVTRPIVSNVLIQATGVRLSSARPEEGKEPGPYHTLTLIVTLHEAELLELASTSSRVRMLLRGSRKAAPGDDDDDADTTEGVTLAELTGTEGSSSAGAAAGANVTTAMATGPGPATRPSDRFPAATPKWTVELIRGAGAAPIKVDFDLPRQKGIMVDIKDQLDPVISGPDRSDPTPTPEEKPER